MFEFGECFCYGVGWFWCVMLLVVVVIVVIGWVIIIVGMCRCLVGLVGQVYCQVNVVVFYVYFYYFDFDNLVGFDYFVWVVNEFG